MSTRVWAIDNRAPLLGLSILLTALACHRGGTPTPPSTSSGTAVFALYTDIKDWDPASAFTAEIDLLANVYETLVRYQPPGSLTQLAPGLATDWSASADGTRWTFHLRPGVRFHDGTPFDAAAVKACLDRTRELGLGAAYIWSAVTSIEAPAPDTVVIQTSYPAPIDLIASSQYGAYLYSEKASLAGADWFNLGHADGTGPYRVASWQPGQQVVLERNDEYWGGWEPGAFDRVLLRAVQSPTTQLQMLRGGEADVISIAPVDMLVRALAEPAIDATYAPSWLNVIVQLNMRSYPTDNLLFRRALAHAWDYDGIDRYIYYGRVRRAHGIIPAGMWGHDPDLAMPDFDLEEARRLLEASGVPREDWRLTLAYNSVSEEYKNIAKIFQRNLATIGVRLTLRPGPWGMLWSEAKNLRTAPHAFLMVWWPTYPSPADWLTGLFRTEEPAQYNLSHYSSPSFDRLVAEGVALEAVERDAAIERYRRAQALLVEDAAAIFVGDFDDRVIHRADLEGVSLNPAYRTVMFHGLRARGPVTNLIRYLARRLGLLALVLLGVMTITFVVSRVLPASPVELLLGAKPTAEQVERMSRELGLDRPLPQQYARFVGELARGELGKSFRSGRPVLQEVRERAGASVELVTLSLLLAVAIGIPLGILLAVHSGGRLELALRLLAIAGGAIPTFFIGLLLQLVFFGWLGWLPLNGRLGGEIAIDHPFARTTGVYLLDTLLAGDPTALGSVLVHLVLPVTALALSSVAVIARVTANLMIEVLGSDFIRTARAYGVPSRVIHYRLALRPALASLLTVIGLTYGFLLGNSVFVEFIFDWPGLGEYALRAVLESDYPAVMGVTLVLAAAYLLVNLTIDLVNLAVDPRLRAT